MMMTGYDMTDDHSVGMEVDDDNNNDDDDDVLFCNEGMAMNMFMDGFRSSLFHNNNNNNNKSQQQSCVIFLAPRWVLNTSGKFVGAMIYTVLLCILNESLVYFQSQVRKRSWWYRRLSNNSRKLFSTFLYGLQQFISAAIMLISMTFSIELFSCVILGMVVGKIIFPQSIAASTTTNSSSNSTTGSATNNNTRVVEINNNNDAEIPTPLTFLDHSSSDVVEPTMASTSPRIRHRTSRRMDNTNNAYSH